MKTIRVHQRSGIESWAGWPSDVVERLRDWNRHGLLTFTRLQAYRVFQCEGCYDWHEPARNGVAVYGSNAFCDHCLIVLARTGGKPA